MTIKPRRPWKNFDEYLLKLPRYHKDTPYPCLKCNGAGWVRDPEAQPDPIEGYKMAQTLRCISCGGTGEGDRASHYAEYRQQMAAWRERMRAWRAEKALVASARRKLTPDERRAVGIN